jgi:hypothetical protein
MTTRDVFLFIFQWDKSVVKWILDEITQRFTNVKVLGLQCHYYKNQNSSINFINFIPIIEIMQMIKKFFLMAIPFGFNEFFRDSVCEQ